MTSITRTSLFGSFHKILFYKKVVLEDVWGSGYIYIYVFIILDLGSRWR
jgi:hypothetical protein